MRHACMQTSPLSSAESLLWPCSVLEIREAACHTTFSNSILRVGDPTRLYPSSPLHNLLRWENVVQTARDNTPRTAYGRLDTLDIVHGGNDARLWRPAGKGGDEQEDWESEGLGLGATALATTVGPAGWA
jgi:hypothetical protein